MDLKPNYKTYDKDAKIDLVAFRVALANMIMRLRELTNPH